MSDTVSVTAKLLYGDKDAWSTGTNSANACQGRYDGTSDGVPTSIRGSRCGLILFEGLTSRISGKSIQSITINITLSEKAGYYSRSQQLQMYTCDSDHQSIDTTKVATSYATTGSKLDAITLDAPSSAPNQSVVFNSTTNKTTFNKLKSYFSDGNSMICIYNGETTLTSNGSSDNYLRITACSIDVVVVNNYTISYDRNGFTTSEVTDMPSSGTHASGTSITIGAKPTVNKQVESNGYKITLDLCDGSGRTNSRQSKKIESSVFSTWNTNSDGKGTSYNPGTKHTLTSNLKLYLICKTEVEYTSVTLPSLTRSGYTFLGWGESASQTTNLISAGSYTPTKTTTLYAIWKANGSSHLFDGESYKRYQIYIYDGDKWKLYLPKIYDGYSWDTVYM